MATQYKLPFEVWNFFCRDRITTNAGLIVERPESAPL